MTILLEQLGAPRETKGATLAGANWRPLRPDANHGLRESTFSSNTSLIDASGPVLIASGRDVEMSRSAWFFKVAHHISDLARLSEGWDSYGAQPLNVRAAQSTLEFLSSVSPVISQGPAVSLTPEGGLICEWRRERADLVVECDPDGELTFYWSDGGSGQEREGKWEGKVDSASLLVKLLWDVGR